MNHQQEQMGRAVEDFGTQLRQVVEAFLPSPSMIANAILAFQIVILVRYFLGYTLFGWVVVVIAAGDLKAEHLPFRYLVASFFILLGLLEVVYLILRACNRCAHHLFIGFATAMFLAFFYQLLLQ